MSKGKKSLPLELVSFDAEMLNAGVVNPSATEDSNLMNVYNGIFAVTNITAVTSSEGSSFEVPFSNPYLNNSSTTINISPDSSEVLVKTISEGKEVVESSVVKVNKKDIESAVRLSMLSHMEKLVSLTNGLFNESLSVNTKKHDDLVMKKLSKSKVEGEVLLFKDLEENIYQRSKGLSNSQLTKINDSYAHYLLSKSTTFKSSSAMTMGKALHCFLFTPELFDTYFKVNETEESGATNAGKFKKLYLQLESIGKDLLTVDEYNKVMRGAESFMKHPVAPLLLKEASFEESFYTMVADFLFRGRIDCYILNPSKELKEVLSDYVAIGENEAIVFDLKFTFDNNDNDDQFSSTVLKKGHHRQGSTYCSFIEKKFGKKAIFILATVESSAPNDVMLYQLDEAFMEIGDLDVSRLLTIYKEHQDNSGLYKGRHAGVKVISPPHWYMQKFGKKFE